MLFQFVSFSPKLDSIQLVALPQIWSMDNLWDMQTWIFNYHENNMSGLRGCLNVHAKMRCQSINYLSAKQT